MVEGGVGVATRCLLPYGLSLSAPAKAAAAAPASPGPNPTGLLVVIGLVLLMTTTGLLSVLREANSQHVLYGRDEVAVGYRGPLCASSVL